MFVWHLVPTDGDFFDILQILLLQVPLKVLILQIWFILVLIVHFGLILSCDVKQVVATVVYRINIDIRGLIDIFEILKLVPHLGREIKSLLGYVLCVDVIEVRWMILLLLVGVLDLGKDHRIVLTGDVDEFGCIICQIYLF